MPAPIGNRNAKRIWRDARAAMLEACLARGMTFLQTSEEINRGFGTKYSRCAIAGAAARHKLKSKNPAVARPSTQQVRHAPSRKCIEAGAAARRKPEPINVKVIQMTRFHPDNLAGLRCDEVPPTIWATFDNRTGCRWPYGDRAYVYCNLPHLKGFPYCRWHMALSVGRGTYSERSADRISDKVA